MHPKTKTTPTQAGIAQVEKDGHDGLLVTFSDGTTAGYIVEELLALRPIREPAQGFSVSRAQFA